MAVGGGNRDDVEPALNERTGMTKDALPVEFAEGVAGSGDRRAADQTELGVTRGFELGLPLLGDLLHIAHGDEAVEAVFVVDDEQFVYAYMLGEELVGQGDRVVAEFLSSHGVDLGAGGHCLGDRLGGVAGLDHVPREESD